MKIRVSIPWRKIKDKAGGIEMLEPDIDGFPEILAITDATNDVTPYHGKHNVWDVEVKPGSDLSNLKKKYTVL